MERYTMTKTPNQPLITQAKFPKYKQLLLALIANLVIAPFLSGLIGAITAAFLFFYAIFCGD